MPDVHVPKLDEHDDEEPTAPVPGPVSKSHHRRRARESQGLPRDAQEGADNYTAQQEYAGLQRAIVQSTIYGRSWTQDFEGVFRSILNYKGDVSSFDPALLKAYDEVIPEIDRALGE